MRRLFFESSQASLITSVYLFCFAIFGVVEDGWVGGVRGVAPVHHAHFNLFCVSTLGLRSLVDLGNKMIVKVITLLKTIG